MSKRKEQRWEKNFRKQQGARKGVSKRRDKSTVSQKKDKSSLQRDCQERLKKKKKRENIDIFKWPEISPVF